MMGSLMDQTLMTFVFIFAVYFHLARKNFNISVMYGAQSLAIVVLLFSVSLQRGSLSLLLIAALTFIVKVILAPTFFARLIARHQVRFAVSSYASAPITLVVIAIISAMVSSRFFAPITHIAPGNEQNLALALSAMLISIFLMINRKGALSQIIGILSLENCIVAFALFAGLEQSPTLQLGIIFDIFVWIIIASMFVSMLYKHFGSLDVTTMKHLKD